MTPIVLPLTITGPTDDIDALDLAELFYAAAFDRQTEAERRLVRAYATGTQQDIGDAMEAVAIARRLLADATAAVRRIRGDQ
ncbi:hypothetical protein GA0070609_4432 [Micromonospora echinaurantiaca]|uniref:Uncharacterized protein n=1 Tax=Micromonospora echinaurantiaca TaxID=47857 RepID=A0A1C5JGE2_9ACTN|nr:hypothetical protein [Micromonospora echinaurantiaca]SCG69637.1 hypothetical protein GA0070609_4432 [Micromonospora echinaurantiaca]